MATSPPTGASGDEVGRRTFSTSFRGFDQGEVRAYLEVVAAEFTALRDRVAELESQLEEATRPAEPPAMDVATLTSLVGEETARVLRVAQEAADDLRTRAEEGAARILTEAHEEAGRIRGASEAVLAERTAEAEASAAAIRSGAQEHSDKVLHDARAEADRITHEAIEQGRDMVSQAQAARERVLGDLARRRRSALAQIDQLRAGRERLETSLGNVRAEVDRIHRDLAAADEAARQVAEVASRSERRNAPEAMSGDVPGATSEGPEPEPAPELDGTAQDEPAPEPVPEPEPEPAPDVTAQVEPGRGLEAAPVAQPEPAPEPDVTAEVEVAPEPDVAAQVEPAPEAAAEPAPDVTGQVEPPPEPEPPRPHPTAAPEANAGDPVDAADRTADALQAEEALISARPRTPRRSKSTPTSTPSPPEPSRPPYVHDPVPVAILPSVILPTAVLPSPEVAVAVERTSQATEPESLPEPEPEPPAKVDELFARIRADRAVATEDARATLAAAPARSRPHEAVPKPDGDAGQGRRRKRAASAHHPSAGGDAAGPGEDAAAEDFGLKAPRTDAEETYLQRRDVLVEVVQATTVRALRRSLADDQNAALDKFRTARSDTVEAGALLGDEEAQVRSWSRRAVAGLAEGAAAGAHLASGGSAPAPDAALVAPIAERLGAELVGPLRARLAGTLEAIGRDRGSDAVDRINSVFREWRSRIERTVGDAVTEAVSAGFMASAPAGAPVAWVVEDLDGPCPDCDDNALAGSTPLGEAFPTGQTAPPAHPGCRCVLTRAPA